MERAKALHKQTKGQRGCFKAKKGGHVLLQIPKTRCAVGPLYCQHVWMPCSINFSLNSLTRIYETCNMGLQLFWSLHTCSTRCRLRSHFNGRRGGGKRAEVGRSWRVASCSVKSFKCIYTLLCLLGTVFYTLMRAEEQVSLCYSWHRRASRRHTTRTRTFFFFLFPPCSLSVAQCK